MGCPDLDVTTLGATKKDQIMLKTKTKKSNDLIRQILLQYLYDRNANSRSARSDKTGAAGKISIIRKDLKASHGLKQQEVRSNLTYLISEGWVEEQQIQKSIRTPQGGVYPSSTSYYQITARGIDRIEGPGEFTMDKFHGIKIEATGQNIITVGDGNQVDSKFQNLAEAFVELKEAIKESDIAEKDKLELVGDIDSIQSQLAKSKPNKTVIGELWNGIKQVGEFAGITDKVLEIAKLLSPFLQ